MRLTKNLRKDQEIILRFLDVFGGGFVALGAGNKYAQPGFFIIASNFIVEFIHENFFRKEALFLNALEEAGFPADVGPVGAMYKDQEKCRQSAEILVKVAREWQSGDEDARPEIGWAASEYLSTLRQHLERLKNLIFPLLEQNISDEAENGIAGAMNNLAFEGLITDDPEKYVKVIGMLQEELSDWK